MRIVTLLLSLTRELYRGFGLFETKRVLKNDGPHVNMTIHSGRKMIRFNFRFSSLNQVTQFKMTRSKDKRRLPLEDNRIIVRRRNFDSFEPRERLNIFYGLT